MKVIAKHQPTPSTVTFPWRWIALAVAGLLLLVAAVGMLNRPDTGPAPGSLAPERTRHEFGEVRMQDGLLIAQIPVEVEGPTRITALESS